MVKNRIKKVKANVSKEVKGKKKHLPSVLKKYKPIRNVNRS